MSQEHSSTPRRSFPKPILSAFGSTGSLQRKTRGIIDKNSSINYNTPETPLKTERSKFIVPSNLSPYALSPKLLIERSLSINKSTDLRNDTIFNINYKSESFEDSFLNSPSQFSRSPAEDNFDLITDEDSFDQNYNIFFDKKTTFEYDYEPNMSSASPSIDNDKEFEQDFEPLTELWKSSKVKFLNEWTQSEEAFGKIKIFLTVLI